MIAPIFSGKISWNFDDYYPQPLRLGVIFI
nr:MAG TPA: hypothetical protein [Caudoviricetes sp.]